MSKYFLFLDTETTGLDPQGDALLEVAWFLTNEHFEVISDPRAFAVNVDEGTTIASLSAMNDYVRQMHTATGLLEDIDSGATLDHIFEQLVGDLDEYVGVDDTVHIAGFSIHFDVDFLKANDFNLFSDVYPNKAKIHHRFLDLSSVKMILEAAGLSALIGPIENDKPHRALNDAFEALFYANQVKQVLGTVFPFEPVPAEEISTLTTSITIVEGNPIL